jgi:hypothetical protein
MNKSAAGPVLGIVTPPRHVFILECFHSGKGKRKATKSRLLTLARTLLSSSATPARWTLANLPIRITATRTVTRPPPATRTIPPTLRVTRTTPPAAQATPTPAVPVIPAPRIPAAAILAVAVIEQQHRGRGEIRIGAASDEACPECIGTLIYAL